MSSAAADYPSASTVLMATPIVLSQIFSQATGLCGVVAWYGLTSYSTHFKSFRRRWGDCGISQDYIGAASAEAIYSANQTVCAVLNSVARPLLITVCVLFERPCVHIFQTPWLELWVSLEHAFTCVYKTSSSAIAERPRCRLG